MRHLTAFALPCLLAACATTPSTPTQPLATDAQAEVVTVTNNSPFDVAACAPRPLTLVTLNEEVLTGVLVSVRPMLEECLVDPKHRGPAADTQVTVRLTAEGAALTKDVSGTNLSDAGKACLTRALEAVALSPKEQPAAPVSGQIVLGHGANDRTVKLGLNQASDLVASIRLSQPAWCDCYGPLGTAAPPTIKAVLTMKAAAPAEIVMTSDEAEPKTLTACLEAKLKGQPLPTVERELQVPYSFLLLSSYAEAESPSAKPEVQFAQLDAIHNQRRADVAMSIGARALAQSRYAALVDSYKKKPNPMLIKALKAGCAEVLAADDVWISAFRGMLANEERLAGFLTKVAASDARWEPAKKTVDAQVLDSQGKLAQLTAQRAADEGACPKVR